MRTSDSERRCVAGIGGPYARIMYFDAISPYLDAERVKYLDDSFLRSDPWSYFRARIRSLIRGAAASEAAPEAAAGGDLTPEQRLRVYLQVRPDALDDLTASAIETQVAADAYALRHHAAECLIRFTAAVARHRDTPGTSLWEALAETANQIEPVIREVRAVLSAPGCGSVFMSMVTPPRVRAHGVCDQKLTRGVAVL